VNEALISNSRASTDSSMSLKTITTMRTSHYNEVDIRAGVFKCAWDNSKGADTTIRPQSITMNQARDELMAG
jgi:hypothetical protein